MLRTILTGIFDVNIKLTKFLYGRGYSHVWPRAVVSAVVI